MNRRSKIIFLLVVLLLCLTLFMGCSIEFGEGIKIKLVDNEGKLVGRGNVKIFNLRNNELIYDGETTGRGEIAIPYLKFSTKDKYISTDYMVIVYGDGFEGKCTFNLFADNEVVSKENIKELVIKTKENIKAKEGIKPIISIEEGSIMEVPALRINLCHGAEAQVEIRNGMKYYLHGENGIISNYSYPRGNSINSLEKIKCTLGSEEVIYKNKRRSWVITEKYDKEEKKYIAVGSDVLGWNSKKENIKENMVKFNTIGNDELEIELDKNNSREKLFLTNYNNNKISFSGSSDKVKYNGSVSYEEVGNIAINYKVDTKIHSKYKIYGKNLYITNGEKCTFDKVKKKWKH